MLVGWPDKPFLPFCGGLSASINFGDQAVLEAQHFPPPFHWHWSQIQSGHWVSWLDALVIVIGTHLGWIDGNELT